MQETPVLDPKANQHRHHAQCQATCLTLERQLITVHTALNHRKTHGGTENMLWRDLRAIAITTDLDQEPLNRLGGKQANKYLSDQTITILNQFNVKRVAQLPFALLENILKFRLVIG